MQWVKLKLDCNKLMMMKYFLIKILANCNCTLHVQFLKNDMVIFIRAILLQVTLTPIGFKKRIFYSCYRSGLKRHVIITRVICKYYIYIITNIISTELSLGAAHTGHRRGELIDYYRLFIL